MHSPFSIFQFPFFQFSGFVQQIQEEIYKQKTNKGIIYILLVCFFSTKLLFGFLRTCVLQPELSEMTGVCVCVCVCVRMCVCERERVEPGAVETKLIMPRKIVPSKCSLPSWNISVKKDFDTDVHLN